MRITVHKQIYVCVGLGRVVYFCKVIKLDGREVILSIFFPRW